MICPAPAPQAPADRDATFCKEDRRSEGRAAGGNYLALRRLQCLAIFLAFPVTEGAREVRASLRYPYCAQIQYSTVQYSTGHRYFLSGVAYFYVHV